MLKRRACLASIKSQNHQATSNWPQLGSPTDIMTYKKVKNMLMYAERDRTLEVDQGSYSDFNVQF